jgi:ParB-like chromosome segregation protein Spo0J
LYKRGNEPERMARLAEKIKENLWIETPIVGIQGKGFWLIEGQHRVRAMAILGFKTVPVIGIEYEEE